MQDASSSSIIEEMFNNRNPRCIITKNVLSSDLPYSSYDVCWIANPIDIPSDNDLLAIKAWLAIGNKKLIITYETGGSDTGYGQ